MPCKPKNLAGQKFGKLTVISFAGYRQATRARHAEFNCLCDCGSSAVVAQRHLIGGNTKSCGCLVGRSTVTHGQTNSPEFQAWVAMRSRCQDSGHQSYKDYGARGIKVCDRWQTFESFFSDMGARPSSLHSLDRYPDNNGNYEPGNCRWATWVEQGRNKRNNRHITLKGETLTLSQWVSRTGISRSTITNRLAAGWSVEEAMTRGFSQGRRDVANRE